MALPSRFNRPKSPARTHLVEIRRGLLRLHKALIDSERAVWEREHGALSNGMFLQALLENEYFAWLRAYSGLLVEVDEALAGEEPITPDRARQYTDRIEALAALTGAAGEEAERYARAQERDPAVRFAHGELFRRIAAAREAAFDAA